MVLIVFSSCQKRENYVVEYPELYTPEYCTNNYIQADPNLLYIAYADNSIGRIDVPGGYARYYAIKDVPVDEYLLLDEAVMFAPLSYKIVKNKYKSDLPQQEIVSYKIKSVLIYSQSKDLDELDKKALGEKMVDEIVASIDGNDATAFQSHIIDCMQTKNYKEVGIAGDLYDILNIRVRVVFENYENLVWDSNLYKQNDTYYILVHTYVDDSWGSGWKQNMFPINQKLAELIP